jgi:hypothetical protein
LGDHLTGGQVKGREQGCGAVADGVAGNALHVAQALGLIESPSQDRSQGARSLGLVGGNGSLLCQNILMRMTLPT